ncbi:MAG TPA: NEW3 domain-containing protein [Stellaceae bacterium]|jgi:uncharacterized membrane protein|nr:NEW3 domain-containing protein [Stellaceae bacterium]
MQRRLFAIAFCVLAAGLLSPRADSLAAARPGPAREMPRPAAAGQVSGVYLSTQYPALTVRAGETATIDLTLHNYHLPPQQLSLSVPQVASGWKATILGGGQPVAAAMVGPDSEQKLQLRLEPPAGAGPGDYRFLVAARGDSGELRLPITLTVGQQLPAKLKLSTNFPALRGTAETSFKFTVTVANDSGRDATINLTADAPKNFQVTFTEAYGSQQITSIPIGAGKSKDIDASVALPRDTPAGDYKLVMHAKSEAASAALPLAVTIFGQPRLSLSGEGGRLSGEAYAGKASPLSVVVRNDGSEAARDVELSATAPDGWKTSFDPKGIAVLAAGKSRSVQVTFTPSDRAIAGDYQTTIRANAAAGQSESADFRITVLTSTIWGMVGIGVIAVALLVVVFAVARYGRR